MQRDHWSFSYSAKKIAEGAAAKRKHHQSRLEFWIAAKEKVMAEVRESGIEVLESEAGPNYSNTSRGYGPQVMVRSDLQTRLNECHTKIQEHTNKIKEYAGWVEVLEGNSTATLSLHSDDYLFFFGG